MNILVVNDDGISSTNIFKLKEKLKKYGNVYICVPDGERSGSSHSIKKKEVLEKNLTKLESNDDTYIHKGTASDSVRFFLKFVNDKIDLVISGINQGFNLGIDTIYSGTLGAALEANVYNIKSIALSARKDSDSYWENLNDILELLINKTDWSNIKCFNVNFPDYYTEDEKKYKFTHIASTLDRNEKNSDYDYCRNKGYITISPVKYDLTDYDTLKKLEKEEEKK